jgi:hypothetical protein
MVEPAAPQGSFLPENRHFSFVSRRSPGVVPKINSANASRPYASQINGPALITLGELLSDMDFLGLSVVVRDKHAMHIESRPGNFEHELAKVIERSSHGN